MSFAKHMATPQAEYEIFRHSKPGTPVYRNGANQIQVVESLNYLARDPNTAPRVMAFFVIKAGAWVGTYLSFREAKRILGVS